MTTEQQPQQGNINFDAVISKYIELRDAVDRINKRAKLEAEPLEKAMSDIETYLMDMFNRTGQKQIGTDTGTAFVTTKTGCNLADKDAFKQFLLTDPRNWALLTLTANKTAVGEYISANGNPPPGVNWTVMKAVQIRRGK